MIIDKNKILLFVLLLVCNYACIRSSNAQTVSDKKQILLNNLDSIMDFENSKNEWKRSNIHTQSRIESDNDALFDQYPVIELSETESSSLVFNYQWQPDQCIYHNMFIEISDSNEIELNKTHEIPNEFIKIRVVYSGMFSSFELFKNVEGTIVISTLQSDYAKIHLTLAGDL